MKLGDDMIYAIGDLHLGFSQGKTMDQFGSHWERHFEKIKKSWISQVKDSDLVLIAGDISWANSLKEAQPDLDFIKDLTGNKLLLKGNHDYWWSSLSKLRNDFGNERLHFLQNDCFEYQELTICGTRGWNCPGSAGFTNEDQKIYNREVERLKLSLKQAKPQREILVMMHFPPMNEHFEPSGFTDVIEAYGVKNVVYGHVHGVDNFEQAPRGVVRGVCYQLISADYLDFKLTQLRR